MWVIEGHLSSVAMCGQAVPPFMALSGALPAMLNDNSSASQPGRAKLGWPCPVDLAALPSACPCLELFDLII